MSCKLITMKCPWLLGVVRLRLQGGLRARSYESHTHVSKLERALCTLRARSVAAALRHIKTARTLLAALTLDRKHIVLGSCVTGPGRTATLAGMPRPVALLLEVFVAAAVGAGCRRPWKGKKADFSRRGSVLSGLLSDQSVERRDPEMVYSRTQGSRPCPHRAVPACD